MKKRLLASVMSLCMILSLLPVSAFAEETGTAPESEPACICNVQCTEDTQNTECPVCAEDIAGCTAPAQVSDPEETTPTQDDQTPEEDSSAPTEEPSQPTEPNQEPTTPEEDPAAPVEDSTDSTQETAGTAEDPAAPVQDPSDNGGLPDNEEPIIQNEPTPQAGNAVYVSTDGSDTDGDGSQDKPYATLAKAVDVAQDGDTIYVMSDLTMTSAARYWNKNLTITSGDGGPYTVTRGDFNNGSAHDSARQWYNSALIEVGGTEYQQESSLRLENIVLDDGGYPEGTYYVQADTDGDGQTLIGGKQISNTEIVQDAIIATYNNTATITLGNGAVLKNFGGMSAIRLSGGVLIMEAGSKIIDDSVTDRTKEGSEGDIGPAGAVWMQGGTFTMNSGAEIQNVVGRAVYVDSGVVNIYGSISNIKGDPQMWWGEDGVATHIRNGADVTLEEGSTVSAIKDADEKGDTGSAVYATSAKATLNGIIENCYIRNAVFLNASQGVNAATLNGTVRGNTSTGDNGYIIVAQTSDLTVGSSGVIEQNNAGISTVYAPAGANIDLYGSIQNNVAVQCGGIHLYSNWNGGRDITVDMYDGAKIINNKSSGGFLGLSDRGGAICSGGSGGTSGDCKSIFTMHGGEISGNESVNGAVFIRKNGQAYIQGGGDFRKCRKWR